jgi:hypothetical protein
MESTSKTHWPSIGILVLSGGGVALAILAGAVFVLTGLINIVQHPSETGQLQGTINLVCISFLIALVLLPSTVLAIMRLMGKTIPHWRLPHEAAWANAGMGFVPLLIVTGILAGKNQYLALFLIPMLQIGIVALPLIWLLVMSRQNLSVPSSQHNWGLAAFSLTVTIPLIILIEAILVAVIVVAVVLYLKFQYPGLLEEFSVTLNRLMTSEADTESVLRILRPYIGQPVLIYFIIAIMAGIIPLMEELFKPLALWFFASRPLTPKEGLLGGMICGASFALYESLGSLVTTGVDSWAMVAIGRIGTGILHVTASGLVGWGMAKAWSERRYGTLAAAYLAAFAFHSMWNLSALMTGFRELAQFSPVLVDQFNGIVQASPFILVMLAGFMVSIVLKANIDFQKAEIPIKE